MVETIESHPDPETRDTVRELVQALLDLHRAGLAQIVEHVAGAPEAASDSRQAALEDDPLVASLLMLHGLHPRDRKTRVAEALERIRPAVHHQGGDVSVRSVVGDTVYLQWHGDRESSESGAAMQSMIETAVADAVPDAGAIVVERSSEPVPPPLVQLTLPKDS